MKTEHYKKNAMKNLPLLLLLLLINTLTAQQSKKINEAYTDYFNLSREIPYLHLNKTTFVKGENIWFKAYILNLNSKKLHRETSNLYCSLFDENGILIDQKLVYVKNGMASGNFKTDASFKDKNYYIKASTNYMKNFKEDEAYVQEISIVNNSPITSSEKDNSLDFQLLPEGGYLISNTYNSLGIIVKNAMNNGVRIKKGEILENNKVLTSFSTNKFGLAKVNIFLKPKNSYKSRITLNNNSVIVKEFPTIEQKGINLHVNNPHTKVTEFVFSTNKNTLQDIANKNYYFLIHNTNHYLKRKLIFRPGIERLSFLMNNKKLQPGTNIITLFNSENKPIAERVFFNYNNSLFADVETSYKSTKDSLEISISKENNNTRNLFLSASILPNKTVSYNPENSIISKFLLRPYIKGDIENPNYYFKKINRRKLHELDLLLLTQGWSKYNWHRILNSPPIEHFEFDQGITIQGVINSKVPKGTNQIFLASNDNNLLKINNLNGNKFEFKNLYLDDESNFSLATITNNKKLKKVKAYIRALPTKHFSLNNQPFKNLYKSTEKDELIFSDFSILKETIKLDEVIVNGKKRIKNQPFNLHHDLSTYSVEDSHFKNRNTLDFIRAKGFDVIESFGQVTIRRPFQHNRNVITTVFLDNQPIQNQLINQLDFISNLTLDHFEEIFISKSFGGTIYLFTNRNFEEKKSKSLFSKFTTPLGYSKQKKYYQPKYSSNTSKEFKNYGTIYWEPNIDLKDDNFLLKLDHLNQKHLKLFIEGISEDGKLIRTEKIIDLKK